MFQKKLIVVCGPTAIGKTSMAIRLAQHYETEILSADSRQFYREMAIGTAVPSREELAEVPHHFVQHLSIENRYTAGMFATDAQALLTTLFQTKDMVVLVGGSGLFIKAVTNGLDEMPTVSEAMRKDLNEKPLAWLQEEVAKLDPAYFAEADVKNPRRLVRALEVIYTTGKPYSAQRIGTKKEQDFSIIKIGLEADKETMNERINKRVDGMLQAGLLDEVKALLPYRPNNALNTVGYKELFDYFDGLTSLETATERIKQHTRQYAKRQLTWFKKDSEVQWFPPTDFENILKTTANERTAP